MYINIDYCGYVLQIICMHFIVQFPTLLNNKSLGILQSSIIRAFCYLLLRVRSWSFGRWYEHDLYISLPCYIWYVVIWWCWPYHFLHFIPTNNNIYNILYRKIKYKIIEVLLTLKTKSWSMRYISIGYLILLNKKQIK